MQIDKQHWKICARCDKSWDDDGAFYCDHQEKCPKIKSNENTNDRKS